MADEEKTEPATPRRRQEARKKGQVAKSQEFSSAFLLLIGACMLGLWGKYMYVYLQRYTEWMLSPMIFSHMPFNRDNVAFIFTDMFFFGARVLIPIVLVLAVTAFLANFLQIGFKVASEPIKPKLNKIDPIKGAKNLISMRALTDLVKSIAKVVIVGYIAYSTVRNTLPQFAAMSVMEIGDAFSLFAITTLWFVIKVAIILLLLAILDYAYQIYDFEKGIKMSKQEIKDEHKQREGDPMVRRRIRQKQREIAMRRMMASVPEADVVITNPIELAVALTYEADEMHAPKVVAKGGGVVAERIKEIAREHDVPIVENPPLAQSLFKMCDIDDYIPPNLYKAVAEILAYVYRISKTKPGFGI